MEAYTYFEACGVQGHTSIECYKLLLALNTSTLSIATTLHHKINPTPPPIAKVRRVTQILFTRTPTLTPRVLTSHLISTIELPTIHPLLLLLNPSPT